MNFLNDVELLVLHRSRVFGSQLRVRKISKGCHKWHQFRRIKFYHTALSDLFTPLEEAWRSLSVAEWVLEFRLFTVPGSCHGGSCPVHIPRDIPRFHHLEKKSCQYPECRNRLKNDATRWRSMLFALNITRRQRIAVDSTRRYDTCFLKWYSESKSTLRIEFWECCPFLCIRRISQRSWYRK